MHKQISVLLNQGKVIKGKGGEKAMFHDDTADERMLEFVPGKKNLVLYGPMGIGKTHMAIAESRIWKGR